MRIFWRMSRATGNRFASNWLGPVLFAGLYGGMAALSLATTQTEMGIAIIWPSSGVLVAGLLLLGAPSRAILLGLIVPTSVLVNLAFGASLGLATGLTVANVLEGFLAARIACGRQGKCGQFDNPQWVVRFALAAICASAASAVTASIAAGSLGDPSFLYSWFATVLLGMLIVAPIIVNGVRSLARKGRAQVDVPKACAAGAFALFSIVATFAQTEYPLLFLPVVATVLLTFVLGVTGALIMTCAITVAATVSVIYGSSPIAFVSGQLAQIYFTQFYLAMIFVSALPLAALLARPRAQMAEIARRRAQHEAAQAFAHVGHWRYCLKTNTSEWSDGMFAIYGLDPKVDPARNLEHGSIIEEDTEAVRKVLEKAVLGRQPFTLKATIRTKAGEIRHIGSLGNVEIEDDAVIAIFGVLKDVTAHVAAMQQIEAEKERAEAMADKSLRLSETDQLTGIANRRKLLETLDREIARAQREGTDLSIVMIDVDHFKSINDRYGHGVGDEVLKHIARLGSMTLRKGDVFGRLGGEEFLAILPSASTRAAARIGERLRRKCEDLEWGKIANVDGVSISLGVARYEFGYDETSLLHAADQALYFSKGAGRNRLTVADQTSPLSQHTPVEVASR